MHSDKIFNGHQCWRGIAMEWTWPLVVWSGICIGIALLFLKKSRTASTQLPPGPPGWPVIGNIFDLDAAVHRTLAVLSQKYGPVMWLRLGAVNTMVISSAEAAMVMFKNHDVSFAGRTTNEAMRTNSYHEGSMALAEYGPYWRMLRRICTTELFTNSRINGTEDLRSKCVDNMIRWIRDEAREKGSVEVARFASLMSFNVTSNVMLSKDLTNPQSKEGAEFFSSVSQSIELAGKPNIADFFPVLRRLDPQGIRKEAERRVARTQKFAYGFLKERILERQRGVINIKKDFLDVMLEFEGNRKDGEPFGAGRRICVGMSLAHRTLHLALGTMIQSFEWALEEGMSPENMDMNERLGVALRKAIPLKVVLKNRVVQQTTEPTASKLTIPVTV